VSGFSLAGCRVLGALRPVSAVTRTAIVDHLEVAGAGLQFLRKPNGLLVIVSAAGFSDSTRYSEQPLPHAATSFAVEIRDPARHWLPRRLQLTLPRDPTATPTARARSGSLFRPVDVELLPAAAAALSPWWAAVRVAVRRPAPGADPEPVGGALVRLRAMPDAQPRDGIPDAPAAADAPALGYGLSDPRGEALVIVPALPAHTFADGIANGRARADGDDDPATTEPSIVIFDTPCELDAIAAPDFPWPLDHGALATRFGDAACWRAGPLQLQLRAGARLTHTVTMTPPGSP
jgi:hypothetical protein